MVTSKKLGVGVRKKRKGKKETEKKRKEVERKKKPVTLYDFQRSFEEAVNRMIDSIRDSMNEMDKWMEVRFDRLDNRLDKAINGMNERLEGRERDFQNMNKKIESVESRVDRLDKETVEEMGSLGNWLAAMEKGMKDVEEGKVTLNEEDEDVRLDKAKAAEKGERILGLKNVIWFDSEDGDRMMIKERVRAMVAKVNKRAAEEIEDVFATLNAKTTEKHWHWIDVSPIATCPLFGYVCTYHKENLEPDHRKVRPQKNDQKTQVTYQQKEVRLQQRGDRPGADRVQHLKPRISQRLNVWCDVTTMNGHNLLAGGAGYRQAGQAGQGDAVYGLDKARPNTGLEKVVGDDDRELSLRKSPHCDGAGTKILF